MRADFSWSYEGQVSHVQEKDVCNNPYILSKIYVTVC